MKLGILPAACGACGHVNNVEIRQPRTGEPSFKSFFCESCESDNFIKIKLKRNQPNGNNVLVDVLRILQSTKFRRMQNAKINRGSKNPYDKVI